mmetsp:Transcript_18588/g.42497  ORF Transcript_18588/g.42497 Transcript_18588/m.42497 type:complete len:273 (-) Transcript_18588:207-1025(-)
MVFILHLMPTKYSKFFLGKVVEGFTISLQLACWCACLVLITSTSNYLAVDCEGTIVEPNLFYFSWASFVACLIIFLSYVQSTHIFDPMEYVEGGIDIKDHYDRLFNWFGCLVSNVIVWASTASMLQSTCNPTTRSINGKVLHNRQALLGMVIGICGSCVCLYILIRKLKKIDRPGNVTEFSGSICLSLLFLAGVVLLTGEHGSGGNIGNLYYSVWGSFYFSTILLKDSFLEFNSQSFSQSKLQDIDTLVHVQEIFNESQLDTESAADFSKEN